MQSRFTPALAGAALCFGLRLAAIRFGWHLPTARHPDQVDDEARDPKHGEFR